MCINFYLKYKQIASNSNSIIEREKLISYYQRYGFDIEPELPINYSYIGSIPMITKLDKIAKYCAPSVKMDGGKKKR